MGVALSLIIWTSDLPALPRPRMAVISIRVIVGMLIVIFLGCPPVLAQPAPASEAKTSTLSVTESRSPAEPSGAAPAADSPGAPTPAPAAETPSSVTPAPATQASVATAPAPAPTSQTPPLFRAEQLDRLLAPIALYPDALLAQILMAATYPLEIIKAQRWLRDPRHAALQGDLLAGALEAEGWDPSVKALVAFPQVLQMMDANLDWTEQLGDAVLAQQGDVMDAIQRLRYQAAAAGTLWSNAQQKVMTEGQGIVIEPANPALIYPPVYNPDVYDPWPYPDYPPLDIEPPDYGFDFAVPFGIGFGVGYAVVRPLLRRCAFDWGGRRIRLDVDAADLNRPGIQSTTWQHDPAHRRGIPYLDLGSRERFGVSRDRPVTLAAIPRVDILSARAAIPTVRSSASLRAFAPVARGTISRGWINPGAARPPMMLRQPARQLAWRQPAASMMPRASSPSRAAVGGSFGFEGRPHR
jgi:hypothetical protein